jgi:hypothetical protein
VSFRVVRLNLNSLVIAGNGLLHSLKLIECIAAVAVSRSVLGIYFYGGYSVEMQWREKVRELEAKVALAEEQSKTANAQLETKIVEKTKVIHDLQVVYKEKIVEVASKIDAQCVVAPEALNILNEAAKTPGASK